MEISEIDERGIRRLAQSRSIRVTRNGFNSYEWDGVELSDDELWDILEGLPQSFTLGGKGRRV